MNVLLLIVAASVFVGGQFKDEDSCINAKQTVMKALIELKATGALKYKPIDDLNKPTDDNSMLVLCVPDNFGR
jgi:hypothetical protein